MRYRLIYSRNGEQCSEWTSSYSYIHDRFIRFHNCGYDVEIWEYNDQGSRLIERSLHNER